MDVLYKSAINGDIDKFNKIADGIDISDELYAAVNMYRRRFPIFKFGTCNYDES